MLIVFSQSAQIGTNAGMPAAVPGAVPQVPGGYQAAQAMAGYNQYAQYYAGGAQPGYPQAAYGGYHYPGQQQQQQSQQQQQQQQPQMPQSGGQPPQQNEKN